MKKHNVNILVRLMQNINIYGEVGIEVDIKNRI